MKESWCMAGLELRSDKEEIYNFLTGMYRHDINEWFVVQLNALNHGGSWYPTPLTS